MKFLFFFLLETLVVVKIMTKAKKGDTVQVEYVGKLEDGTVFDSSEHHGKPLEFTIGNGQVIEAFENAFIGMNTGDEKEIKIPPNEAYGEYDPNLVKALPKDCFPPDQDIQPGMMFSMNLQNGHKILVRITKVEESTITVDLNPPLAGKTLVFNIKLVGIAS